MYCSHCEEELLEGSRFCSRCGATVETARDEDKDHDHHESAAGLAREENRREIVHTKEQEQQGQPVAPTGEQPVEQPVEQTHDITDEATKKEDEPAGPSGGSEPPHQHSPARRKHILWLLPVASVCLSAAAIGMIYYHQMGVNDSVERLLREGEKQALSGKLQEGMTAIESALLKRPDHPVLLNDRKLLEDAMSLEEKLAAVDGTLGKQRYEDSLAKVTDIKRELKKRSAPVFGHLNELVSVKEEETVVKQVTSEYPNKETLADLSPLLYALKDYKGSDAKKTAKKIVDKMVNTAYEKAAAQMTDEDYFGALDTIDEGYKAAKDNEKLKDLENEIWELIDKNSGGPIMNKSATWEELKNNTAAIEILTAQTYSDELGNFVIEGSIRNKDKRTISYLTLYYDLYDANEQFIDSGYVYVYPDEIKAGAEGTFSYTIYDDSRLDSITITSAEWQLY